VILSSVDRFRSTSIGGPIQRFSSGPSRAKVEHTEF
jgi:hypothetical protein